LKHEAQWLNLHGEPGQQIEAVAVSVLESFFCQRSRVALMA
jgi:hypothetical protein